MRTQKDMKKRERIYYETDPNNRLVRYKTQRRSDVAKFRKVLDGRFRTDKNNSLVYTVKKASDPEIPEQVKLKGNWSLNEEHNLVFTLNARNNQSPGSRIVLQGKLSRAEDDALDFKVTTRDRSGKYLFYIIRLRGRWRADARNRLSFEVKKRKQPYDILTLRGSWELNKHFQVVYAYAKTLLKRKKKIEASLLFKGHWELSRKLHLSYVINRDVGSYFDFTAHADIPSPRGEESPMRFTIGIRSRRSGRPVRRVITFYGTWKITKRTKIIYEIKRKGSALRPFVFGSETKLGKGGKLILRLTNSIKERIGIEILLSKNIGEGKGLILTGGVFGKSERAASFRIAVKW